MKRVESVLKNIRKVQEAILEECSIQYNHENGEMPSATRKAIEPKLPQYNTLNT